MRKLKIMEHFSLDGVIQQSVDADDFPHSEWTVPYRTPCWPGCAFCGAWREI
jgi:hypothetical protein